ncbi:hypothetical protein HDA32_002943 [Spinactinospora alkalitolerans]|uniref:Uncharacterized protein n=1 Tax=Spinactinospora alkalitolerans TaxID=687207 RepID=A0A852TYE5_9ACTN|nr:DUF6221 family protein [Spinactinospora alkalitolerans]NYE47823.1 hypothetical protein [Spinactinospora alkalitolerans]
MTLVEFLQARLDEDERVARQAAAERWRAADTRLENGGHAATVADSTESGTVNTLFPAIVAQLRPDNGHLGAS